MRIRRKVLFGILLSLSIITAVNFGVIVVETQTVEATLEDGIHLLATTSMHTIDTMLERFVGTSQSIAAMVAGSDALQRRNAVYTDVVDVPARLDAADRAWRSGNTSLQTRVLNNSLSYRLKQALNEYRAVSACPSTCLAEIIVADAHGGAVAASGHITDYDQSDEGWWRTVMQQDIFVNISKDRSTGTLGMVVAVPVIGADGNVSGALKTVRTFDVISAKLEHIVRETDAFESLTLVEDDGRVLSSTADAIGTHWTVTPLNTSQHVFKSTSKADKDVYAVVAGDNTPQKMGWYLIAEVDKNAVFGAIGTITTYLIGMNLFVIFLGAVLALYLQRSVTRPLEQINRVIAGISKGELEHKIPERYLKRNDEIGALSRAFKRVIAGLKLAKRQSAPALKEEKHAIQETLQRREETLDEAPIGAVITDPAQEDNPIIYANQGFLDLTGYEEKEVIGRNCRFLRGEGTDPDTVAEIAKAIEQEEPITTTILNYREDGEPFWNELHITPITDDDGEAAYFLGFQSDVTEYKDLPEGEREG